MAYHTPIYLFLFLPLTLLIYQITPQKKRWIVLLAAGYLFFWLISGKLLVYLIGATLFTHYIGLWLAAVKERSREETGAERRELCKKREKRILIFGILGLLAVLAYLKYYNFFAQNMNFLLQHMGQPGALDARDLLLPVGISFYTLQAVGYLADVYWEKISAERHLGKMALFLGFFPQIMEGPISMYTQTADALWRGDPLKQENISGGYLRVFWGLFKKMVIADRLNILVASVFDNYESYSGAVVATSAIAYTIQLYMEFSGCMDIIIGSGRMFGISLPENFRQPFLSKNAAEFWRRWHITLGAWFKTYIFYPVSVSRMVKKWNRFGRKHLGKYLTKMGVTALCLFPVWLCNGLWHGPRWSYIFYGMYYFVMLLCSAALEPVQRRFRERFRIGGDTRWWNAVQILKTWIIIFAGELFFRANGLRAGIHMFLSIFRDFSLEKLWDGTLLNLGMDAGDFMIVIAGCCVTGIIGILKEKNVVSGVRIRQMKMPARWGIYYALILAVVIFGAYGAGYQQVDLIYAKF